MAHSIVATPRGALVKTALQTISVWKFFELARQRRQLKQLDARLLADIGVGANAAKTEANRPFWDVPAHWRK